jgi:hypothetical protein
VFLCYGSDNKLEKLMVNSENQDLDFEPIFLPEIYVSICTSSAVLLVSKVMGYLILLLGSWNVPVNKQRDKQLFVNMQLDKQLEK